MASGNPLLNAVNRIGLVPQIIIGLMLGVLVGSISPKAGLGAGLLGELFVGALKAVAPVLVFVLVTAALVQYRKGGEAKIKPIIILYLVGTFAAAAVAVAASMAFPTALVFKDVATSTLAPPSGIIQVLKELLMKLVSNPINAIAEANYIGILAWALVLGSALRHHGSDTTRQVVADLSDAVTTVVQWVIRFAPLGIFGLVSQTVAETGFSAFLSYGRLLAVLLGSMAFIALVVNPLIVWSQTRKNPYGLVFTCLRESGLYAFFTRSSAANIPVNMAGAAITITVLAMAAAYTKGIVVDYPTALLLSLVATVGACGASGVAGGSLLLIPVACSLLGIDNDFAMRVVGVGMIIGVIQDSAETALNSSTDVLFTAAADLGSRRKD